MLAWEARSRKIPGNNHFHWKLSYAVTVYLGCVAVPFIFFRENLVEGPGLELADMSEFT